MREAKWLAGLALAAIVGCNPPAEDAAPPAAGGPPSGGPASGGPAMDSGEAGDEKAQGSMAIPDPMSDDASYPRPDPPAPPTTEQPKPDTPAVEPPAEPKTDTPAEPPAEPKTDTPAEPPKAG